MSGILSVLLKNSRVRILAVALILLCIAGAVAGYRYTKTREPNLLRLLARLPPPPGSTPVGETEFVVSFSNPSEMKLQHGFEESLIFENVPVSMMAGFLDALGPAGICAQMDVYFQTPRTQMDIGYDVMAVERCIQGTSVTVLEGDFDPHLVDKSLRKLGYSVDEYKGVTTYHYGAASYSGDEVGRELANAAGHVAALKKTVITAATVERLHAALDVQVDGADSLSTKPQYVALARALGPVTSAGFLLRGDRLVGIGYREVTITEKEAVFAPIYWPPPSRDTPPNWWEDREAKYEGRHIVLVSIHATTEEAAAEAEELIRKLENSSLSHYWQELGDPAITTLEEGSVMAIIMALTDDAPSNLLAEIAMVWP